MENNKNKIYTLYAGVNGAGKSTIYSTTNYYENLNRVNPDEILVSNGGDWRNEKDQLKAGREAVRRINSFIEQGISFNQETTLCGQSILRNIQKAKEQGFSIKLYYVGLNSPELAVERVKGRVSKGGHGIPEETIKKRYETSLEMLTKVLPLCDKAIIYDNSIKLDKIARYKEGNLELFNEKCQWFNKVMSEMQKVTNRVSEKIQEKPIQSMDGYKAEIERLKKDIGKSGQNNSIGKEHNRMDWNKDKKDR